VTVQDEKERASVSLFWRLFATNAAILVAASLVLALSPATVSSPLALTEAVVLAAGLTAMLILNLVMMRRAFDPLRRLTALMRRVDPLRPGKRIPVYGDDTEVLELTESFNQMLDRIEDERRSSARRLLAGQEAERRRIAQELHDEIGQTLTALLLQLGRAAKHAPADLRTELEEAQEAARSSIADVHRIVGQLRPEALDDLGLASALTTLTDRLAERTGLRLRRRIDRNLPPLAPEQELVIYRIAQESLTNAVRHADADAAELRLHNGAQGLVLSVADDGSGMSGLASNGGGIRGMRERAVLIGAQLAIDSQPGRGVEVRLTLPPETLPGGVRR
jgi:two-component system, NarL family, sensor histidine kinase UhpB